MSRPPGSENLLVLFLIHVGTGPGVTGTQPDSGSPTTLEAGIRFDDESHPIQGPLCGWWPFILSKTTQGQAYRGGAEPTLTQP